MSKLHEVLAVEQGLKKTAKNVISEAAITFSKKHERFSGFEKNYKSTVAGDGWEAEEAIVERQELTTTVHDKLVYVFGHIARNIDCMASKDATNQEARADIIVDEEVLVTGVPVTTLLSLEDEIARWRDMILQVPTLASGQAWEEAADLGSHIYRLKHPEKKVRNRKKLENHRVAAATKEHPEQVQTYSSESPVGFFTTERISGALTVAGKSAILDRVDNLFRAVKKARQRANSTTVIKKDISGAMVGFI